MNRRHRLLIVTHRFGHDIPGGAERHLWELAVRFGRQEDIECEVWATDALGLDPVAHWGAELKPGYPVGDEPEERDGIRIRRFRVQQPPRAVVGLVSKAIQRQWEREETALDPARLLPYGVGGEADDLAPLLPGPGWHHPEPQTDGGVLRWTMPRFTVLRKAASPEGALTLSGFAPRRQTLRLVAITGSASRSTTRTIPRGWFSATFDLPAAGPTGDAATFEVSPVFAPLRDHRALGLMVGGLEYRVESRGGFDSGVAALHPVTASLTDDYRSLLRRRWDDLVDLYTARAEARPDLYGALFDWTRGPRCPSLWRALADATLAERFDGILAANLPWGVIPKVAETATLPFAALALWHLDDEFYYWKHYMQTLRKARVVLSNTEWAARVVWPRMGIRAQWAGPGVDGLWAERPPQRTRAQWRGELGLPPDAPVVLCVCRKSAAKRYDLVVAAVERLRASGLPAVLVLVGPEEDRRPISSEAVIYAGRLHDDELHEAYCHADVFAMMSESESFGMVFVEAWLRERPVVGNRGCAPVASLIDDGEDGFLASGVEDLAVALERLLRDPDLRRRFGAAGRVKTQRDHVWSACVARAADALRTHLFD